jgi:hypothetical protein
MDVSIERIDCHSCGASFWIPSQRHTDLVQSKASFYCPNGHGQHFTTNESDQLRQTIRTLRQDLADARLHSPPPKVVEKIVEKEVPVPISQKVMKAIADLEPPAKGTSETQNDYVKKSRIFQQTIRRVKKIIAASLQ